MVDNNKFTYIGQLLNGKPDGYGILEINNNSIVKGQFKEGLFHGKIFFE